MHSRKITIASLFLGAASLFAQTKATTILPPHAPFHKEFGTSIAMAGNSNMLIGSEFEGGGQGSVSHYQGSTFKSKIDAKDIDPSAAYFGLGTALNQTWLVAGAPSSGPVNGKVFLFKDGSSNYNYVTTAPLQTLTSPKNGSRFGAALAIEGDWLAVGAKDAGTVYIYNRTGSGATSWVLSDSLKKAGNFGNALAMNGNRLVVGATGGTVGNVYVFERNASGKYILTYDRSLNGRPSWASINYGIDVDITSSAIIIGDNSALKAEVLTFNGSSWVQNSVLVSKVPTHGDFGLSVAIQYNRAVVGAPHEFSRGSVYLYTQLNNVYTFQNRMVVDETDLRLRRFGYAVDISDNDYIGATSNNAGLTGITGDDKGVVFYNNFSSAIQSCGSTYESNNSIAAATTIANNSTLQACINSSTDQDFYKLVLPTSDNIKVLLDSLPANYDVQVLNSGGSVLYTSSTAGTATETINAALTAGTYYIKVYGVSGANSGTKYLLTVKTNNCNDAIFEPNNTLAAAKILVNIGNANNNRDIYGAILTTTDQDWFGFDTFNAGAGFVYNNLKITLTNLNTDLDLKLYNSAGVEIGSSTLPVGNNEQIILNGSYIGRHYVKVYGFSGANSTQCYDLKISVSETAQARAEAAEVADKTVGLSLFPNPAVAGEKINLGLNLGVEETVNVRILNISGLVVSEQNLKISNNSATLDLSQIKAGIYLIDAGAAGKTKLVVE